MAKHSSPEIEAVAAVTQRLAVLLAAGVAPASAWQYVAEPTEHHPPPVLAAAAAARDGGSVPAALVDAASGLPDSVAGAWRGLAAAWFVATEAGAPLANSLRDLAGSFRDLGQTQRDVSVALAGPVATARMVMALPAVGVLFGLGLGFNTLKMLFATTPGLICLALATLLVWGGIRWNRRLVASASPKSLTPGLAVDLMAIAMSGGGSVDGARALVGGAKRRFGLDDGGSTSIDAVISLAQRAGVPAAELLRSEADQVRRQARSDAQRSAAALSVKLMMPLGICVLPAFMLVGVAPLLMAVLSSTITSI